MRKRGEKHWNSKLTLQGQELSLRLYISRKLEDICQSLTLPVKQGDVITHLTNPENVQRIDGLVEDLHEALMEYQVCISTHSLPTKSDVVLDFIATRHL